MDAAEQIRKFEEFIELNYLTELLENSRKNHPVLSIDYVLLSKFDTELAEILLEDPENVVSAAEVAIDHFDIEVKGFRVRFKNVPKGMRTFIRDIRSKHIGKFLFVQGVVRQKSPIRPQVTSARFECPACGNVLTVLQLDDTFKEPSKCSCGRKGRFKLLSKELVDAQAIVLEESSEDLDGGEQPKRMNIFLKNDLVSPLTDKRTNPGTKVVINGILKEVPIPSKTGGKLTRFDLMIEANFADSMGEDFGEINISDKEKEDIIKLSQEPKLVQKLVQSIAPTIYGHDRVKEALLLQLVGGVRKKRDDGVHSRGDIHMLLIGDPGAGKCLHKDTKIVLGTGEIAKIGDFVEKHNPNEKIAPINMQTLGLNGKIGFEDAIRVWKREEKEKLLEIKTRTGKKLKLTKNHPLFSIRNGFITAKEALDFSIGERIATPRRIRIEGEIQKIERFNAKKYSNNSKKYIYPEMIDKELARFLGYLCGDGYVAYSKTTGWISFTNNDETLLHDFKNLAKGLFNAEITERISHKGKTAGEVYFTSKSMVDYLKENFGEVAKRSAEKDIPKIIQKSQDNVLKEFIQALFDCEAHLNLKKRQIEFCTISEELAENLSLSLLRFGIITLLKRKTKYATNSLEKRKIPAFELIISGEFVREFQEKIGFLSEEKKEKLKKIISTSTAYNTNIDLVPNTNNLLTILRKDLGLLQKEMGIPRPSFAHFEQDNRLPSNTKLKKIVDHLRKEDKKSIYLDLLEQVANADVFWDEIIDIKEIDSEGYVYDLEIKNTHNYIANGVVVHNSQLLKRMLNVSPKARYVSGKGASGAGLTASVVKDEFLNGWSLEAGALVLANRGLCLIDELDKMGKEDRSAMHEALEQQCFDYDTIITFADGSERKIGEYVEETFSAHPDKIIEGKDCLILEEGIINDKLLTTGWNNIFPCKIDRVSKHKTTDKMYKITFTNGRHIVVTPEHPVFCFEGISIQTKRADKLTGEEIVPAAAHLPIKGEQQFFNTKQEEIFNPRAIQHIKVPAHNDDSLFRIIGYLLSEGSKELNRRKTIGINFTNKDRTLLEDFKRCMQEVFGMHCYEQERKDDYEPRYMLRYISTELTAFLQKELPEVLEKSDKKRIPDKLMKGRIEDLSTLLLTLFEGDGHVSKKQRTIRIGYGSNSRRLVEQVQDILLRLRIRSSITTFKNTYKVNIAGYENIKKFHEKIGFVNEKRRMIVREYLEDKKISSQNKTYKDVINGCGKEIISLMQKYKIKKVGKNTIASMRHDYLKKGQGIAKQHLLKLIDILKEKKLSKQDQEIINFLEQSTKNIVFEKIKKIEVVESKHPWTYDVTIEPHHTFISQGIVLHNTITISKANIQATLNAETTVLAAANPKFGRFDPYGTIPEQIDLPNTLINRFDLIFPIKDLPDKEKDSQLASFILDLHQKEKEEPEVSTKLIRKYISYARQHVFPVLTEGAIEEIKSYYLKMRGSGTEEGGVKSIPISARQLEALVRLSEATAKLRLSDKVTRRDAKRGVDMLHYCLTQIGVDPETGQIDIDRISTGITSSQRGKLITVREIITELESKIGKTIPLDDVIKEAMDKGIDPAEVEESIEKLKRSGDIFEPRRGFIQRI